MKKTTTNKQTRNVLLLLRITIYCKYPIKNHSSLSVIHIQNRLSVFRASLMTKVKQLPFTECFVWILQRTITS